MVINYIQYGMVLIQFDNIDMGGFIGDIQGKEIEIDTALLNCTYSKLIQYYSSYKSICEDFTINIPEYIQIFGPNHSFFSLWDTKKRGKIDAIQIFSGIIIFSGIKYEQKLKFLFQIFDFNEEGCLQYEHIALMIVNICNATYKIYQSNKSIHSTRIQEFLDEYFTNDSRIELQELIRWALKVPEICSYMKSIGFQTQAIKQTNQIDKYTPQQHSQSSKKTKKTYKSDKDILFDNKFLQNIDSMMIQKEPSQQKLNLKINWIYGINMNPYNIKYLKLQNKKAGNEIIIYCIGKIIVIYYPKLRQQKYYKNHQQDIVAIEISKFKKIIASAENGQYPQIHIWDIRTRLNIFKFKRLHKSPITFLNFLNNDKYLVTTSFNQTPSSVQSPIIILNIQTKEIIMSTSLSSQILGLAINHQDNYFLTINRDNITKFTHLKHDYQIQSYKIFQKRENLSAVLSFAFFSEKELITSHKGRKFYIWDEHFNGFQLRSTACSNQVLQMKLIQPDTLLLLDQQDIQILTFSFAKQIKKSHFINMKDSYLYNLHLLHFEIIDESTIFVMSTFGDVIKISDILSEDPKYHKYYEIFKLQSISDLQVHNNDIIVLSSRFLYVFDKFQKQLKAMKKYDFDLHRSQMVNDSLLIQSKLQSKSSLLVIVNLTNHQTLQQIKLNISIDDIKMTQDYILILSDNAIHIYNKIKQQYFHNNQPIIQRLNIDKCLYLIKINSTRYYIINEYKDIYLFVINQAETSKVENVGQKMYRELCLYYPQHSYCYPFVVHYQSFAAFANKTGGIYVWNSVQDIVRHFPHSSIDIHTFGISKLVLHQKQLYSAGSLDGMVTVFKHQGYLQENDEQSDIEEYQKQVFLGTLNSKKSEWIISQKRSSISKEESQKSVKKVSQLKGNYLKEGYIEILGLDLLEQSEKISISQEKASKMFKETTLSILLKDNQSIQEGMHQSFLNVEIQYIFGIDCNNKYKNVYYIHNYSITEKDQNHMKAELWQNDVIHQHSNELLQFSKPTLMPTEKNHGNCKRQIAYYSGRYCILRQKKNKERYYEHHRRKISCIAVHPNRQIICSCEVNHSNPYINIWETQGKITLMSMKTKHKMMIVRAQFSRDGEWLVTLGGQQRGTSIQVINWLNEQTIAFQQLQEQIYRDCIFNPFDKKQFCIAGTGIIRIYKIEEELFIKQEIRIPQHNIQVIVYTSNIYGADIESDVIAGTTHGDIAIYVCGSFIISKKLAHQRGVTCLTLVELFRYKKVLISGGGDGFIKIWDTNFNQISKRDIREQLFSVKNSLLDYPLCQITSLDIYQCSKKNNEDLTYLIISTSDGSILQANITNENQGYQMISLPEKEVQILKEKINVNLSVLFSLPPNIESIQFEIHNNLLLVYNTKSKFIYLWNLTFSQREIIIPLDQQPIFIRFINNQPIFLAAFVVNQSSVLQFYQLDWAGTIYVRSINLYSQLSVPKEAYPKNAFFSKDNSKFVLILTMNGKDNIYYYKRTSKSQRFQYDLVEQILQTFPSLPESKPVLLNLQDILWIQFASNNEAILIAYKNTSKQLNYNDDIKYKCIHLFKFEERSLREFSFENFDFSAKIKGFYLPFHTANLKDYYSKDKIQFTAMIQFNRYIIAGTESGEIIIADANSFTFRDSQNNFKAKTLILCDKPIAKLQLKGDRLYVNCQKGQNIMVFKLCIQKSLQKAYLSEDRFSLNYQIEEIDKKIKQVFSKRNRIEIEQQYIKDNFFKTKLRLGTILGRNAYFKRNNVFVDLKGNIISHSGCNIMIMKYDKAKMIKQKIIKPNISPNTNHPEISSMILGQCKKLLAIGTCQQTAKIIVWDISTNTYFFHIKLNDFICINLMKLSKSNKHLIIYATAKNSQKYLIFINLSNQQIMAIHHFSKNIQVNDLCFAFDKQYTFIACGVNYMADWNYQNKCLIEKKYTHGNIFQTDEIKSSEVIFYSVIVIEDLVISSGNDGYIYVWKEGKAVKRQTAHPKEPILSLYTNLNSKVFATGANNGTVIIWQFSNNLIIQKINEFSIYTGNEKEISLKYQVQSICMSRQSLIVGNRAGQILHFPFTIETKETEQNINQITSTVPIPLLYSFDHEKIISCDFNASSTKLYIITESLVNYAIFTVFDVKTLQKITEEKVELKTNLIKMIACKLSSRIFLILKNSIMVYNYETEQMSQKNSKFYRRKQWLKCDSGIKNAIINSKETFLAVLVAPGTQQNAKVQIYDISKQEGIFYQLYKTQLDISTNLYVIDFCTTHDYFFYQKTNDEQIIIDLQSKQKIKASSTENQLEWRDEAKKNSSSIKDIMNYYTEDNRPIKIVEINNKCIVVTDQMGSIRVFNYPIIAAKQEGYQMYIEHLNHIYICVLSPNGKILVTAGQYDKALHIWQVFDNTQKPTK